MIPHQPAVFITHDPRYAASVHTPGAYYSPLPQHTPAQTLLAATPYASTTWQSPAPGPTIIINNVASHPSASAHNLPVSPFQPGIGLPAPDELSDGSSSSTSTSSVDLLSPVDGRLTNYLATPRPYRPYHLTFAPGARPKRSCWSRLAQAVREMFSTPMVGDATPQQPQQPQQSAAPLDGSLWSGGYYFGPDGRRWIFAYDGKTMTPVLLRADPQAERGDSPMQFLVHNKQGTSIRYM
ncbi:unnamed protein product [Peniophora sp. CBMAI 1063]|nr:unnamed protein product [Peniophora sp. CBMAI 1063]